MNKPKQTFSIFITVFLACFFCYLILGPSFKLSTRLQQIVEESLPKTQIRARIKVGKQSRQLQLLLWLNDIGNFG